MLLEPALPLGSILDGRNRVLEDDLLRCTMKHLRVGFERPSVLVRLVRSLSDEPSDTPGPFDR